ncbi:MAG: right-handed parallel beta-helix repeat-containing protein [Phycisphaerales bacterium]|nr:MAG: right-handed parallel beta-helix repeat-containing protein [Phycisphaerales bacterium]
MKRLPVGLLCVLLAVACQAKTIIVSSDGSADYERIQDAIHHSWDGDSVVIKPGTYRENVSFMGRAITVTGENPDDHAIVRSTIISAVSGHSVTFDFGEDGNSVLTGLTISGRGIYCSGASPVISRNVIRDCENEGIHGQDNAAPAIEDNVITSNGGAGIYWCDGPIRRNIISQNNAGIAYCNGLIVDNIVSDNSNINPGYGGGLYYCDGDIVRNTITDNYASFRGGGLYGCDSNIGNNLIAGNSADLLGGGLSDCAGSIYNNTVVGNRAGENGGGFAECAGSIQNNIIAFNRASSAAGIYGPCNNSYNSFWVNEGGDFGGGATVGVGDIAVDPLFAINGYWDPNGTPEAGDDFWIDGDYHLKSETGRWDTISQTWVSDQITSHCVDAGDRNSDWAGELWPHGKRVNMGVYGATAQASMSLSKAGNVADLNNDDWVDYGDFILFAGKWVCDEVPVAEDLNRDGIVNFKDYSLLADYWRVEPPPPAPPIPNPMTWAAEPYATSPYSVAMVASTAISTDGSGVEYYFEDYFNPESNSGWISFSPGQAPMWENTGLLPETVYWYRVKARNRANLLETDWPERRAATTPPEDNTAPMPNPMTWETEPYANSATSIRMVATTASDDSAVEYYFECTSNPAHSSNWQDSPVYEATSLAKGIYKFVVSARDKSPKQNTTAQSAEVTVDLQAPTPDPMKWASDGKPKEVYRGGGWQDYWAEMTAEEAHDPVGVEYYFECTSQPGFSSGWQVDPYYEVQVGRQGQRHRFRVKARDLSPSRNETGWSEEWPAM